jgi:hypothetical protein
MHRRTSTGIHVGWLALLASLLTAATALAVFLFRRKGAVVTAQALEQPIVSLNAPPAETPPAVLPPLARRDRRPLFIVGSLLVLALLVVLPPPFSTLLLVGYVALAVGIGLANSGALNTLHTALTPLRRDLDALLLRYHIRPAQLWTGLALALFCLSAVFFLPIHIHEPDFFVRPPTDSALNRVPTDDALLTAGALCLLLGGLALALSRTPAEMPPPTLNREPFSKPRLRPLGLLLGVVLLALLTEISADMFDVWWLVGVPHNLQFGMMLAAFALLVWGMGGFAGLRSLARGQRWQGVFLLAITLVGLILRVWRLETGVHFMVDELNFAGVMLPFETRAIELLQPRVMSFSGIYSLWQSWSVALFGETLTGLRVVSAVLGTLTIPAVYWLARALFVADADSADDDEQAASLAAVLPLLAALLLATFPPHIHFSRLGLNNIADPLFATLGFGFFAWALRHNRPLDFALAGVCLGMTAYFYEGGRLLYPALFVGWLAALYLFHWQRRPDPRGVITTVVIAVLVALPFYTVILARDVPAAVRMSDVGLRGDYFGGLFESPSLETLNAWLARIRLPFLAYVSIPDPSLFYTGQTPLLLVYLLPPFFAGLAGLILRPRAMGAPLLLGWLLLTALGSTLLKIGVLSPRFVVAFPALMIISAFGLVILLRPLLAAPVLQKRARALLAAVTVGLAVAQVIYYFGAHLPTYNIQFRRADPARDGQDAVLRSRDFPMRTHIHLVGTPPYSPSFAAGLLRYLRPDMSLHSFDNEALNLAYIQRLDLAVDHAFYIEPGNLSALRFLRAQFPTIEARGASPYDLPPGEGYVLYYVEAGR